MTDRLEQLVRDAGDWPVGQLDVGAVATRARQRRNRRRGVTVMAVLVTLAVVVGITAAVWPGQSDRTVVSTTGTAPDVTWTPLSLPAGASGQGSSIAGGAEGLIVIGTTGTQPRPTDPPPVPTIWRSTDGGTTWSVAYTDPNVVTDEQGVFREPAARFGEAYYLNGMFVVTGTVNLQSPDPSIAGIWTSRDGVTWTQADNAAFRAPVAGNASGSDSRLYDVTAWRGQLVAIGDLYVDAPKKKQCCGLGVGVWTSRDGITWEQHIADLGAGFDPYITSLTTRGSTLVGGGSVDIWTGTVWTTRDLRTWHRSTIADAGHSRVYRMDHGFVAVGGQYTGPKKKRVSPAKDTGIPTIWWSHDTSDWSPTLTLPERARGRDTNDTFFPRAETVPGLAIAVGPSTKTTSSTRSNTLYASANGRTWARLSVPGETSNTMTAVLGTNATGIYVSRYVQGSPSSPTVPATVWRVAPTRARPPFDLTVTALPTLKFDANEYDVAAGNVHITFAAAGGSHRLRFDDRSPRLRHVRLDARDTSAVPDSVTVHLEPGRYTIYCAIPGHRGAGMEATINAR